MQELTAMNIPKRKLNYVLWQIGIAERSGTNFIMIPVERIDKDAIRFLRKRNYKLQWMPVRKAVLIEWEYKRSPYRTARASNTRTNCALKNRLDYIR